jgi:DNA (cytosine-5)-methyltransferase 1
VPSAIATPALEPERQPADRLSVLELFSGAGGLALGLARAGFEPLDMIESNSACCETLRKNKGILGWDDAADIKALDVRDVDFRPSEGVDLLAAGAPCQPFSQGGGLRGHFDERNMFPEVIRAIAETRPRAFLIENVRGLLFERAESYFKSVLARLRNPGHEASDHRLTALYHFGRPEPGPDDEYVVHYRILNAADFGLAQNRPRLFIVGLHRDEAPWAWPEGGYSRSSLVHALRSGSYWSEHRVPKALRPAALAPIRLRDQPPVGERWQTLRDLVRGVGPPRERKSDAPDPAHVFVPGARLYARHTGSRLDWVAKTVKAGVHGSPGGEHILLLDDGSHRYLTVRECALLQGFPPDYELPSQRTPAMRQLGNAVPVAVAEAIGRQLSATLRG